MVELMSLVQTYNTLALGMTVFVILLALTYALGENKVIPALLLIAVLAVPMFLALNMFGIV